MKNVGAYDIAELVDDELIHADYSTLPDDTEEQFLTIRKTILKYASDINKSKRDIKEIKSIKNFIGKIFLNIEIETVIAFILQFQLDSRSMIDIKKQISQVVGLIQNS